MNIELIVVIFDKASTAAQALEDVRALEQSRGIRVINAAVLANEDGKVSVKETEDVDAKHGALFGAITGGLLGLWAGPAGVMVGAVAGGATGGVAAQGVDLGFPKADLDDLRNALQPNSSALVLLLENRWVEKVAEDLAYLEGKLYRHALEAEVAAQFETTEAEMKQRMAALAAKQTAVHQELYAETMAHIQAMRTEIEALEAKIETAGADKKAELRRQVETLYEKLKRDYEALNKKIEAQLQQWRAEIVERRVRVANAGHKAKNQLQQQLEAFYLKQDAARAEMQQNLAAQVEEGRAEVERLKAKVAESTTATKEKLQAQLATAQANLKNVQEKLQTAIEAQFEEIEADLNEFAVQMALGGADAHETTISGLESSLLKQVQEDMEVYDQKGDKIGEVQSVYLGSVDEAADALGLGPEAIDDPDLASPRSWVEDLAEVFATNDELPEELRGRLLRHGYIKIDGSGWFASDYYAISDQIASVSENQIQLNVLRNQLIKR